MFRLDKKNLTLFLLLVAYFLYQGTRQILGAALPQIQRSFGVSKTGIGAVVTLFALLYGVCVPLAGVAADMLKRKWVILAGAGLFCLGIFLSGFACGIGMLLVTYGILNGCGQSFFYPGMIAFLRRLHKDSFATAFSILQSGSYVGVVVISSVAGIFAGHFSHGWRIPFWIFGGIGILWTLLLVFKLQDDETDIPEKPVPRASVGEAFRVLFCKPTAICVTLALVTMLYVDFGFKTWMPTFLQEHFLSTPAEAAFSSVLWHYSGAFFGVQLGGRLADRFVKRHHGVRLVIGATGLACGVPAILAMAYAPDLTLCYAAMTLFGFCRGIYDSSIYTALFDVVEVRYHASATGVMLALAFVLGSAAPVLVGWMFEHLSMTFGVASLGGFYFLGALILGVAKIFFLKRDYCA